MLRKLLTARKGPLGTLGIVTMVLLLLAPAVTTSLALDFYSYVYFANWRFFDDEYYFIGAGYDWSGVAHNKRTVAPVSNNDYWLTAVTDHFCLTSGHDYPPFSESPSGVDGQEFRFYHSNDPCGSYETAVAEDVSPLLDGVTAPNVDIRVVKLESPLSIYVKRYPILKLDDYEDYVDQEMFVVGMDLFNGDWTVGTAQAVGKNVITHSVNDLTWDAHGFAYEEDDPIGGECKYSTSVHRESGGPSFIGYGGELHLVGIHDTFDFDEELGTIYTDSAVYAVTDAIQSVISDFCVEYDIDEEFITVVEP